MEEAMRLAVLIDAENVSSRYVDVIMNEANNLGNLIIKRIYANWTDPQMSSWREVILNNSIQPIQQYSNTSGKNSSDSALIIDAMDLLYSGRIEGFCIVSSDSDFTRLASRLRESEKYVLGMGEQKTPQSFVSACNKFSYLDLLYTAACGEQKKEKNPLAPSSDRGERKAATEQKAGSDLKLIRRALVELAEENSDEDGWITSGLLGNLLVRKFPDFDVRNFAFKKFVPFVESMKIMDVRTQSQKGNESAQNIFFRVKKDKNP